MSIVHEEVIGRQERMEALDDWKVIAKALENTGKVAQFILDSWAKDADIRLSIAITFQKPEG